MDYTTIVAFLCFFIGAPAVVFTFIYKVKRNRNELEALRVKRDMLALEVERERLHVEALAEENIKYDRLITDRGAPAGESI